MKVVLAVIVLVVLAGLASIAVSALTAQNMDDDECISCGLYGKSYTDASGSRRPYCFDCPRFLEMEDESQNNSQK